MKKLIICFSLMLTTLCGFGQRLKTVKLDSLVSVVLPPIIISKILSLVAGVAVVLLLIVLIAKK